MAPKNPPPTYGWHFVGTTLRDGRPVPRTGRWLVHDGPLVLCASGLHFGRTPWEALQYAPGPILCRVEVGGTILDGGDKGVAQRRRIVQRMDATELLRYFARMQALSVIHLWRADPPDVVLDYLMTGDDGIRAAARAAAWAAAEADAEADARAAARAAAGAAVGAAACDAASAASAADFNALVYECFGVTA